MTQTVRSTGHFGRMNCLHCVVRGPSAGGRGAPKDVRGEFLDRVGTDVCHGGAQFLGETSEHFHRAVLGWLVKSEISDAKVLPGVVVACICRVGGCRG